IILNTAPGERVMRPDFGCNLQDMIFMPANDQTAALIERYVTEALRRWEPRIIVQAVNVTPSGGDLGEILIEILYRIKDSYDTRSLVYPFYLNPA
ncbi:MAG: GPW/gp25 family protein, partial [Chloroflexota bacterium]